MIIACAVSPPPRRQTVFRVRWLPGAPASLHLSTFPRSCQRTSPLCAHWSPGTSIRRNPLRGHSSSACSAESGRVRLPHWTEPLSVALLPPLRLPETAVILAARSSSDHGREKTPTMTRNGLPRHLKNTLTF